MWCANRIRSTIHPTTHPSKHAAESTTATRHENRYTNSATYRPATLVTTRRHSHMVQAAQLTAGTHAVTVLLPCCVLLLLGGCAVAAHLQCGNRSNLPHTRRGERTHSDHMPSCPHLSCCSSAPANTGVLSIKLSLGLTAVVSAPSLHAAAALSPAGRCLPACRTAGICTRTHRQGHQCNSTPHCEQTRPLLQKAAWQAPHAPSRSTSPSSHISLIPSRLPRP